MCIGISNVLRTLLYVHLDIKCTMHIVIWQTILYATLFTINIVYCSFSLPRLWSQATVIQGFSPHLPWLLYTLESLLLSKLYLNLSGERPPKVPHPDIDLEKLASSPAVWPGICNSTNWKSWIGSSTNWNPLVRPCCLERGRKGLLLRLCPVF